MTVNLLMPQILSTTAWYRSCNKKGQKELRFIKVAQNKITESKLPSAEEMYEAQQGLYDYPAHDIFKILPLGRRKGTLHSNTTRVKNSFFPKAVLLAL